MRKIKLGLLVFIVGLILVACGDNEKAIDAVATVNGEEISHEMYEMRLDQQLMQLEMSGIDASSEEGAALVEILKESTVEALVNDRLILQAANEEGIEVKEEEIESELDIVIGQFESEEQFEEVLKEQSLTKDDLRQDIINYFKMTKYLDQHVIVTEISEEEVQTAYDEYVSEMQEQEDEVEIPSFDDVKERLEMDLFMQKENEQTLELVQTLREKSEIEIYL